MSKIHLTFLCLLAAANFATADDGVNRIIDYGDDIAPLLARHCLECHGPDPEQRQAGLQLDSRRSAITELETGAKAIIPGHAPASELVKRITSKGDDRMPPVDDAPSLSTDEISLLTRWIDQGAKWSSHWAFTPPIGMQPPEVQQHDWIRNPIDQFILAKLEQQSRRPLAEASPRKLIRRVYFDLIGLPPSPQEVTDFLADRRPDAWERLIDRLLMSPQYGQRWGRHWLDVARYGDSNGGDENHAYPLAWRYRDYVISCFNDDLPYDAFVHEQLAGDLLDSPVTNDGVDKAAEASKSDTASHDPRKNARLTATGFLALGTKILAEQDEVKKQADIVDEQVDTVGKTFLALTLGCARCHDHKFDPIPTTDYYALAGIFHSTKLGDQPIQTVANQQALNAHAEQIERLTQDRDRLQSRFETQIKEDLISLQELEAETFTRGNVASLSDGYGEGIGIISDRGSQQNFAEYDITIPADGQYLIQLRYAAQDARPGRLLINGEVVKEDAISQTTGGWMPEHQRWVSEGTFELNKGNITLRLESEPLMSHIDKIRLIDSSTSEFVTENLAKLDDLNSRLTKQKQESPKPDKVMAASEGDFQNVRIHIRGSHMQLGDEVLRGFPSVISTSPDQSDERMLDPHPIPPKQSGRRQLAYWMTDTGTGAGGQTARVIVNRLWHWHFGRGLVRTPNNFGMQGSRPTHPDLLDWLALELIEHDWSLKFLHRLIVTSASYQQETNREANALFQGMARRRMEAEAIRDSLLMHGESLSLDLVGMPLAVKSQDPSPSDLHDNEAAYRSFRRRSVYLPVVRCNTHRFLTLYDFPNAATPVGSRDSTTVPTQALLLMNDPMVMQQAENLARTILSQTGADRAGTGPVTESQQRIERLYELLFQRPATDSETETLQTFLREFETTFTADNQAELKVWAAMIHTLLLSSEFIHVD
ncbi:MAG: DUF1549 domain-containing protein [Rubripirellula sp.]|nr:DUF1549 domain-containing protein [Rubripirellula sp.]